MGTRDTPTPQRLRNIPMHGTYQIDPVTDALRVPGGWIYRHWRNDDGELAEATYVPDPREAQQ